MSAADFVRRWHERASKSDDCFDRFFSAWIALTIRARGHLDAKQLSQPDTDRIAIIHYLLDRADDVVPVLGKNTKHLEWLARRTGTGTGQPILDVYPYSPQHLRQAFDTLALVWSGKASRKPRWLSCHTAELINHVRNNMFHGLKAPDDAADRELLDNLNPILLGLLDIGD